VAVPDPADREVRSVTTGPQGFEGGGFPARRTSGDLDLAGPHPIIDPDRVDGADRGPSEPNRLPWCPRGGFGTVTYIIDGGV
jgi:hypothetical protein